MTCSFDHESLPPGRVPAIGSSSARTWATTPRRCRHAPTGAGAARLLPSADAQHPRAGGAHADAPRRHGALHRRPTASGKSAAALAVAAALAAERRVELVSVDSALVYRGMDIGTAKPSRAERAAVPHHLIDVVEPSRALFGGALRRRRERGDRVDPRARRAADPVAARCSTSRRCSMASTRLPEADPALRAELDARAACAGWPALHAELAAVDPDERSADRAERQPAHPARASRCTAERPAALELAQCAAAAERRRSSRSSRTIRAWLHARIRARFAAMLAAGFVDEVRPPARARRPPRRLPSMRAVGYRQAWHRARRRRPRRARRRATRATRQLAKRQLTLAARDALAQRWSRATHADAPAQGRRIASASVAREAGLAEPVLAIAGLAKRYGASTVSHGVDLVLGARRVRRCRRRIGRRQVDAPQLRRRPRHQSMPARSHVEGIDIQALDEAAQAVFRRDHLGFVFQAFHVLPHLTVGANVGLPLLLQHAPDPARVEAMLDAVGLAGFDDAPAADAFGRPAAARRDRAGARAHARSSSSPTSRPATSTPATAERVLDLLVEQVRAARRRVPAATHSRAAAARADRSVTLTPTGSSRERSRIATLRELSWPELRHHPVAQCRRDARGDARGRARVLGTPDQCSRRSPSSALPCARSTATPTSHSSGRAPDSTKRSTALSRRRRASRSRARVVEGETFAFDAAGKRVPIRLVGIDALVVARLAPALLPRPRAGADRWLRSIPAWCS
jgi:tRNA dimethylallyltransferase